MDADSDGRLTVDNLIATLRAKLPAAEVDYAVEDALVEAGYAGGRLTRAVVPCQGRAGAAGRVWRRRGAGDLQAVCP